MAVKRIVANIRAEKIEAVRSFYCDVLDMTVAMDHGWTATFAAAASMAPQILSMRAS